MKAYSLAIPAPADRTLEQRLYEVERRFYASQGLPVPAPLLPRDPSAPGSGFERQRGLVRAIDETYFRERIVANSVIYSAAGGATAVNGNTRVMRLPDALTTSASATFPARDLWVRTRPKVEVWYTSPTGSTNTFDLMFDLLWFGPGGNTTGGIMQVSWSPAGPAVANNILKTQAVQASLLPSSPFGVIRARVVRIGTDANIGDLDILQAVVTFEEVA